MTQAAALFASVVAEPVDRVRTAVDAHFEAIWRFLRRMGVAERDAEDAAQQVLVVFSQKIGDVAPGADRSFLFATAARVAADYRKRSRRLREVTLEEDGILGDGATSAPGAEQVLGDKQLLACLDRVLRELTPEFREVFVLVELEEMTMADAARALAIPPGTVASRLRRARELFEEKAIAFRASFEKGLVP